MKRKTNLQRFEVKHLDTSDMEQTVRHILSRVQEKRIYRSDKDFTPGEHNKYEMTLSTELAERFHNDLVKSIDKGGFSVAKNLTIDRLQTPYGYVRLVRKKNLKQITVKPID